METFIESEYVDSDRKAENYTIFAFETAIAGRFNKFYVKKNGDLF